MRSRLREVRERLFITQAELADQSGVAESNISRIETGVQQPRPSTVKRLAMALGIEPSELVDWDDDKGKAAA